ncbi:hypothetical protein ABQF35_29635 [Mycobacterium syngnathidarum]
MTTTNSTPASCTHSRRLPALLLVTNSTGNQRDTSLSDMLNNQLPWSHRLVGSAERPVRTAIDGAEHHLARTNATGDAAQEANDLLTRRDELGRTPITTSPTTGPAPSTPTATATDVGLDL